MRKFIIMLSTLWGILYGLKVSYFLKDYDGFLIVLIIVLGPIIFSTILADIINKIKTQNFESILKRFLINACLSALFIFIFGFGTNYVSESIYSSKMIQKAKVIIDALETFKKDNQNYPETLSSLKNEHSSQFVYLPNLEGQSYTLGFASGRDLFKMTRTVFRIYQPEQRQWIKSDRMSKFAE